MVPGPHAMDGAGADSTEVSPEVLIVGHVTRDRVTTNQGTSERVGGAATFAARAATNMGKRTAVVTAAPAGEPLLRAFHATGAWGTHVVRSRVLTTFELDYRGKARVVRLLHRGPILGLTDIPHAWRSAGVVFLGPVAGEIVPDLARSFSGFVAVGLQGWLRETAPDGQVVPVAAASVPDLVDRLPASIGLACLSEEDHPRALAIARGLARRGVTTVLTRGAAGAEFFAGPNPSVPIAPVDLSDAHALAPGCEIDPTGAGDVFAMTMALGLAAGHDPGAAGQAAARAAAASILPLAPP